MKRVIALVLAIGIVTVAADLCPAIERSAIVIGSRVQMHESASGESPILGLLGEGVSVDILGRKDAPDRVEGFADYWYRVAYRGKAGWVFGQFIAPSSGGRGLARVFTSAEMIDYADRAAENLVAVEKAGYYAALVDGSNRLLADITDMAADPILSSHAKALEPFRLLATCLLATGYAGTNDVAGAEKIRKQLLTFDPGTRLPDRTTLGARLAELDRLLQGPKPNETTPKETTP
jgi:hypothetical protein